MPVNYHLQDSLLQIFFRESFATSFYLTGGTALARFYFHHRESIDLDLFTNDQTIDFTSVNFGIKRIISTLGLTFQKQVATPTFLQYILNSPQGDLLKIDLVKDIPVHFGIIRKKGIIRIDALENIGSNKMLAIFGRTDAKDYIDLYWILGHTRLSFKKLFSLAKQKDLGLTEFYLALALEHVQTLEQYPVLLKPLDKTAMISYFQALSQKLLLRIKPKA